MFPDDSANAVPERITFNYWWKDLFLKGQTPAVYLSMVQSLFLLILNFVVHLNLIPYIASLIALLCAIGVLADLVAHLFSNLWKNKGITLKSFFDNYFLKFRTHDEYGQIALFVLTGITVAFSPLGVFYSGGLTLMGVITATIGVLALIIGFDIAHKGFYH